MIKIGKMRKTIYLLLVGVFGVTIFILSACKKEKMSHSCKDAFNNGTSERNMISDFVQHIAATNKAVTDVFTSIIQGGKILVTYLPGNRAEKSIYANSGTWIDHNLRGASTTFFVITPQDDEASSETFVKLYNFESEVVTGMASDSLHF